MDKMRIHLSPHRLTLEGLVLVLPAFGGFLFGGFMALTHDALLEIVSYDPDTGLFVWKGLTGTKIGLNGCVAGSNHIAGYISVSINKKPYLAHRLAWFYVHGDWPSSGLDHIDCDKKNNRISNLRQSNQSQNGANQKIKKNNNTGFKGVGFRRDIGKWRSRIMVNRKEITLGVFDTPEAAFFAYQTASKKYFGEFANSGFSGVEV